MKVFKLTKEDITLYMQQTPTNFYLACENDWAFELIDMVDGIILNESSEIGTL